MTRHTVTIEQIDRWASTEVWHDAAFSRGYNSEKSLAMSNAGVFRVKDHGEIKYEGDDMSAAVAAYNAAP